jgi:hypothetical protein
MEFNKRYFFWSIYPDPADVGEALREDLAVAVLYVHTTARCPEQCRAFDLSGWGAGVNPSGRCTSGWWRMMFRYPAVRHLSFLLIKLAANPAPNPLSMFTTVTPAAQEFNIPRSAASPLKLAP